MDEIENSIGNTNEGLEEIEEEETKVLAPILTVDKLVENWSNSIKKTVLGGNDKTGHKEKVVCVTLCWEFFRDCLKR